MVGTRKGRKDGALSAQASAQSIVAANDHGDDGWTLARVEAAKKAYLESEAGSESGESRNDPVHPVNVPNHPIRVTVSHSAQLAPFSSLKGEDALGFISKYERMNALEDDRTKIENFGQHLDGPATDWFSVVQLKLKRDLVTDSSGIQSSKWLELTWSDLKAIFEAEFASRKSNALFTRNQAPGETGMTYFYRMQHLYHISNLGLDEATLADIIIMHMTDNYKEKFVGKTFTSIDKLK